MGMSLVKGSIYVLALYAWWNVCAHYFKPDPKPVAVGFQPPSEPMSAPSRTVSSAAQSVAIPDTGSAVSVQSPAGGNSMAAVAAKVVPKVAAAAASAAKSDPTDLTLPAIGGPECPPGRRPFHTLLTAQGTIYNQWQARIMYHHWKKQRAADGPCTEMCAQQPCQP